MADLLIVAGLFLLLAYMFYLEASKRLPSDFLLLSLIGLGVIYQSYLGGFGLSLDLKQSMFSSIFEIFLAFLFFLPYKRFYPGKWHLFYYLAIYCVWQGPIEFLIFYFYTSLVCSLLSIILVYKHIKKNGGSFSFRRCFGLQSSEGNSGVQAPYYTSGFLVFSAIQFLKGI